MNIEQQVNLSEAASKVTFAGAGASTVAWLTSSEFGLIMGIVIALAGLAVNWYYKAKQDRRESQEHDAKMWGRRKDD